MLALCNKDDSIYIVIKIIFDLVSTLCKDLYNVTESTDWFLSQTKVKLKIDFHSLSVYTDLFKFDREARFDIMFSHCQVWFPEPSTGVINQYVTTPLIIVVKIVLT